MIEDWVPFHSRLADGPKKAIPRALRFVLLELCLKSRRHRGVLDFPPQWSTVFAVHDLIGGDVGEIEAALEAFAGSADPEENAIVIERSSRLHRLTIPKWDEWAGPKSATERSRDFRARQRDATGPPLHPATAATPTGEEKTKQNKTEEARVREARPAPAAASLVEDRVMAELGRSAELATVASRPLARSISEAFETMRIAKGLKPEWLLMSIRECARDVAGLGLTREALTKKLRSYCDHTRKPREDEPQEAARKAKEAEMHDGPIRMPRPPKEPQGPPATVSQMLAAAEAIAKMEKIGKGAA